MEVALAIDKYKTNFKHGHKPWNAPASPEHRSWSAAKTRCFNPKNKNYSLYGGRGITMCDRWRINFTDFLADMGPRPKGTTLERINSDGDYEPGNCRWATMRSQNNNRRNNVKYDWYGELKTIAEIARDYDITYDALYGTVRCGHSVGAAVCRLKETKWRKANGLGLKRPNWRDLERDALATI